MKRSQLAAIAMKRVGTYNYSRTGERLLRSSQQSGLISEEDVFSRRIPSSRWRESNALLRHFELKNAWPHSHSSEIGPTLKPVVLLNRKQLRAIRQLRGSPLGGPIRPLVRDTKITKDQKRFQKELYKVAQLQEDLRDWQGGRASPSAIKRLDKVKWLPGRRAVYSNT